MHSLVEVEGPAEGLEGRFLQVGFCGTVSADEVEAKAFCLQETLGHDAGFDPSGRKRPVGTNNRPPIRRADVFALYKN